MSAWYVGEDHVNAMLSFLQGYDDGAIPSPLGGHYYEASPEALTAIGKELLSENVRSLTHRYPNDYTELVDSDVNKFEYRYDADYIDSKPKLHAQILKLISCYEYQACEHPEWEDSYAWRFCQWLRKTVVTDMPEWEKAEWGYYPPKSLAKTG